MGLLYVAAGILHFVRPQNYQAIIPSWVPEPALMVVVSGIAEIISGLLLLPLATREIGAWGIILLLIAVFPANIQMTINFSHNENRFFLACVTKVATAGSFNLVGFPLY